MAGMTNGNPGGMNARTGKQMPDELDHIRQSIRDILTTPIGSRIKRREYGSLLPDLIDHPGNSHNRLRLMAATVMAIIRWEPRVTLQSALIVVEQDGKVGIDMTAVRRTGPRAGNTVFMLVPIR